MKNEHIHIDAERMQALLDGDLPAREAVVLRAELDACQRCRAEFEGWQALFDDLGELTLLQPSPMFSERVLDSLPKPERKRVLAGLFGRRSASEPASSAELQEYLDGRLAAREAMRLEEHLAGSPASRRELDALHAVVTQLDSLGRLAPSEGFAEGVMANLRMQEMTAMVMAPTSGWERALSWARGRIPSFRQGWAAGLGVATVPVITFALILQAVFASPLVTVGNLVSFLAFKAGDAWQVALGMVPQSVLDSPVTSLGVAAFQMASASPVTVAATATVGACTVVAAAWVLYRNLTDSAFEEGAYAQL